MRKENYSSTTLLNGSLIVMMIVLFHSVMVGQAYQGLTLFSPNNTRYTYLMNMNNTIVHTWTHTITGGYSCYLLEDGTLLRSAISSNSSLSGGGETGIVQKIDWNGNLLWQYTYSSSTYRSHHDIEPMPNGNVLLIAWELKSATQAVQAGLNHSASIWPDHIIEVQPVGTTGGNIVWEWHAWDHLIQDYNSSKSNYGVVADHPELLDINVGSTGSGDWMHINGISYNKDLDQIVISSHELDEIYVIDHSTTTAQASSHSGGRWGKGGDILYRWGSPANYDASGTQVFNVVHCSIWIEDSLPGAGHIMAFNNREGQGTSMVVEIVPPYDSAGNYYRSPGNAFGPASPVWSYTASGFYSNHLGSCQRLPNGNTLIVESTSGYLFEVDSAGNTEWSYNRGSEVVRALRYASTYPGFSSVLPTLNSNSIASITSSTAIVGATVASQGNDAISERGIVWSITAHPTESSNKVSASGTTGAFSVNLGSLPVATEIHIRGYAKNSIGTGYSTDTSFYTLAPEPAAHVSGLAMTNSSTHQIELAWNQTVDADGYFIVQKTGGVPAALPTDGVAYTVGNTLSDGSIAAVITSNSTVNTIISGLEEGVQYYFSIIPFQWNGSISATYNYKTDGSIPTVHGTTSGMNISVFLQAEAGWQMVSKPVEGVNDSVDVVFPGVLSSGFSFTGGYIQEATLRTGAGYWLKFPTVSTISISGIPITLGNFNVTAGWNLIGSISYPVPVNAITSNPEGMIASQFFGYTAGYSISDTITPGKAYWVKVSQNGTLILASGATLQHSGNAIKIFPTNELPPDPPGQLVNMVESVQPSDFLLEQNYPNPFNPVTTLTYHIAQETFVTLSVYNILGEVVTVVVREQQAPGIKNVFFDASSLPGGMYVYKLTAGKFSSSKKMLFVK